MSTHHVLWRSRRTSRWSYLPPVDPSTTTAKDMTDRMQLEIRNRRNDQLRLTYLMADRTEVFTAIYEV